MEAAYEDRRRLIGAARTDPHAFRELYDRYTEDLSYEQAPGSSDQCTRAPESADRSSELAGDDVEQMPLLRLADDGLAFLLELLEALDLERPQ